MTSYLLGVQSCELSAIVEMCWKWTFIMTFPNIRCHNLQNLKRTSCYRVVVVKVEVDSKQIFTINCDPNFFKMKDRI